MVTLLATLIARIGLLVGSIVGVAVMIIMYHPDFAGRRMPTKTGELRQKLFILRSGTYLIGIDARALRNAELVKAHINELTIIQKDSGERRFWLAARDGQVVPVLGSNTSTKVGTVEWRRTVGVAKLEYGLYDFTIDIRGSSLASSVVNGDAIVEFTIVPAVH